MKKKRKNCLAACSAKRSKECKEKCREKFAGDPIKADYRSIGVGKDLKRKMCRFATGLMLASKAAFYTYRTLRLSTVKPYLPKKFVTLKKKKSTRRELGITSGIARRWRRRRRDGLVSINN